MRFLVNIPAVGEGMMGSGVTAAVAQLLVWGVIGDVGWW
jgi:hypothetical protein